jgi:hypothetical protein
MKVFRAMAQVSVGRREATSGAKTSLDPYFTAPAIGGRPDAARAERPDAPFAFSPPGRD